MSEIRYMISETAKQVDVEAHVLRYWEEELSLPIDRNEMGHRLSLIHIFSKGVAQAGLNTGVPVIFGVLTTDNIEQAIERAGTKAGNKGYDVACTAIEMVNLMKNM